MTYYTASKDEITERTVDPMRMLIVEGRSYLEAWCRRAEGVRLFRLDRIDDVTELDEPAAPPPLRRARPTPPRACSGRAPDQRRGPARAGAGRALGAEYYPVEKVTELDGGRLRIRMRYADLSWMVRLLLGLGGDVTVEEPARAGDGCAGPGKASVVRPDSSR